MPRRHVQFDWTPVPPRPGSDDLPGPNTSMNTMRHDLPTNRGAALALLLAGLVGSGLSSCGHGGGAGGGSQAQSAVQVNTATPGTGPFIGGTAVTLTGREFDLTGDNVVTFGGVAATNVVVVDGQTITCVSPAGAPGAAVDIVVQNTRGEGRLALGFVYATPPPPTSDVNGDGIADLVVAAPADSQGGASAGAVHIFFGRSQSFQLDGLRASDADLKLIGQKPGDAFGTCVCVGDVDGDDQADLVVSAVRVDAVGAPDAGAVYVFPGPLSAGPSLPAQAAAIKLTGSAAVAGDEFGTALEIGDLDGDGQADLVVGAPKHDVQGRIDAGCTYVFRGGASLATRSADQADHLIDGNLAGDRVGARLACGDLDGDGAIDLVLGAPGVDVMRGVLLHDAGRIYVLRNADAMQTTTVTTAAITIDGAKAGDRLGETVLVADILGDGGRALIAAAPGVDDGEVDAGAVYVFRSADLTTGSEVSSAAVRILGVPNSGSIGLALRAGDFDGDSVYDLLVGAPDATSLANRDGVVFVFRGGASLGHTTVASAHAVLHGAGQLLEGFGSSVSALDVDGDGFADLAASTPRWSGVGRLQVWRGGIGTIGGQELAIDADVTIEGVGLGARFGETLARGQ